MLSMVPDQEHVQCREHRMVIAVILLIFCVFCFFFYRDCNNAELRRIEEEAERERALYQQQLDREAQEVEAKCAGKSVEEQVRIREEFCAKLEDRIRHSEARAREIERMRKASQRAQREKDELSPGTKGALLFLSGVALGSMMNDQNKEAKRPTRRSSSCGCLCEDCLDEHEDCYHD